MTCRSCLRIVVVVGVAVSVAAPCEVLAVPARRLARRGVIVVPPPGAEAVVVPVPAPGPAAIVVGPAPRLRRRMMVAPGVAAAPGSPVPSGAPAAPTAAARPTAAPAAAAKPAPASTAAAKPPASAPERIPAPLPTPAGTVAGQPTVAAAAVASSEMIAFTPDWYAQHPQAWRPAKSSADWWNPADAAAITAWLGQPVTAAGTAADAAGAVETAGAADVGADGLRSVLVLPAGHQNGVGPADADWLPLGVFAVVPPGTQESGQAHNYQQLAVDRQGTIKGNFYDTLSGTIQPITGSVDRTSLVASWTVGANGSRFTAPVPAFTGQRVAVSVSTGGQARDMNLMPVSRP